MLFRSQIPGIISGTYILACTGYTSDGSVFSAQLQVASTSCVPVTAGGQGGRTDGLAFGELRYDFGWAPFIPGMLI